ncbi:glycosyltransferase [Emcibacter nanhaiensis]|uniref:Glycosyltransferase n=1 Tax=Emcibacter nanhaiensis TaxID=1505037 RepID=A0A501PGM7_9PROT|nr:glycosyltransferase [Emcibacter nanhaiensis]TPD59355.1 glycosyltransferase [Emcibacter nanhaiensis]
MAEAPNGDKIPHLFHVIPSFAHGGVPIRISYLINHFGAKARHSLIATNGEYDCRSRLDPDIDFSIPEVPPVKGLIGKIFSYRKVLKDLQPDLLLTYNWGSMDWALANSFAPVCRHIHLESGFGPEEAEKTLFKRDLYRRLALRNIESIVVPSHTLVEICRSNWKLPEHKILHIPNGVDCEKYSAAPRPGILPGFDKQEGEIVIGTMTPLRPEKNLPRLIRAFHHVTTANPGIALRLVIMGEGNERGSLENMIEALRLGGKVLLAGHIEEPAYALGWLDLYAISSDTEQMPNSVNQAMAAGLPVVGLAVGDVLPMVSAENRDFIAPAGDEQGFANAMEALVRNPDLMQQIGAINKSHVKNTYDKAIMYREYAKIWGVAE